MEFPIR